MEFVPIDADDRSLVLAWLVAALTQIDVAHTILALLAEQGSAKSTITRCLVDLIDPSPVPLRQPPRDPDGWATAASASLVVALDNLSGTLPAWLSDALCRASTGDGSVKRALYTDHDVAVTAYRRCCIINGVDLVLERGDLGERLLPVDLPRVTRRRSDDDLSVAWTQARPIVLGGLLDLAAQVHHRLPTVAVTDLPRMADFARVLAAIDEVLDTNGFTRYRERSKRVAADTLDDPFIAELVERRRSFTDNTSAEILAALKPADPSWKPPREWPKNARAVTGQLTRHAPALRQQGWLVDNDSGQNKAKSTRWTLTPPEIDPEPDPPHPPAQVNGHKSGGLDETLFPAANPPRPAGGLISHEAGYDNLPDPPEIVPLTSDDGLAGQGGRASGQSLVLCSKCGQEMSAPTSISRGHCERCHLTSKQGGVR